MLEYAVKVSGLCQTYLKDRVAKGLVQQCVQHFGMQHVCTVQKENTCTGILQTHCVKCITF